MQIVFFSLIFPPPPRGQYSSNLFFFFQIGWRRYCCSILLVESRLLASNPLPLSRWPNIPDILFHFHFHIHFHFPFPHPLSLSISTFTFHVHFDFPYTLLLSIPTFTFHTHFPYPLSLFIPTFTLKLTLHNLFLRLVEGKKLVSNLIPLSRWPNIPANKIYGKSPANICLKKKQYMSCFVLPQLH